MDIRSEPHFTLTVTLTDDEVKAIILDPDAFLSQLQDAIAPNGDWSKRSAKTDSGYVRSKNKRHRGKSTAPKQHCDLCGRDIAAKFFNRHMSTHERETQP
jgi:hypothetical protein